MKILSYQIMKYIKFMSHSFQQSITSKFTMTNMSNGLLFSTSKLKKSQFTEQNNNNNKLRNNKIENSLNQSLINKLNLTKKKLLNLQQLLNVNQYLKNIYQTIIKSDYNFITLIESSINQLVKEQKIPNFNLSIILNLSSIISIKSKPQIRIKQLYLKYLQEIKFNESELKNALKLKKQCLQQLSFSILQILIKKQKNMNKICWWFKNIGTLLKLKQITIIDQQLNRLLHQNKISYQHIITFISIFNSLGKTGNFIYSAEKYITDICSQIPNNFLIKAQLNLLELGVNEHFSSVQEQIYKRITNSKFSNIEMLIFMRVIHSYKIGSIKIWNLYENIYFNVLKQTEIIFPVLCGFYRNYLYNETLINEYISLDKKLQYTKKFSVEQFIQFFLVVYGNIIYCLDQNKSNQIKNICLNAITQYEVHKNNYRCIKYFLIYIFSIQKKKSVQYLKRLQLKQLQCVLLSICFQQIGFAHPNQIKEYQDQLKKRFGQQIFYKNKQRIIVEQFIRLKLLGQAIPQ